MASGHHQIRSGAAHGHRKRDTCVTGGFYKSPSAADVVDSSKPLQISWDTSCLDTTAVDIYLFAPYAATPRIHIWQNVDYAYGSYNATLQPSWWNSTKSISLQLDIIESGLPTFAATLPTGPIWNATFSASSDPSVGSETPSGSIAENVNNVPKQGLAKGKIAAAVIMTLLAVAGIAAGVYIWRSRKRRHEKRERFSVAVDKRMSTISTEWKPVTTAGATHAIRSSVYSADRNSTLDGGQAGIGAQSLRLETSEVDLAAPAMAQIRPGFRASTYSAADRQSRVSRVSFAADTRPSAEYRRTRAFHAGSAPPLPDVIMSPGELSPTQTTGPFSLSAEDISAHMAGQDGPRSSMDDAVAPALAMMRTGSSPTEESYVISATMKMPEPELPTPPAPAVQAPSAPQSPILGAMPMPSLPGSTMTPDDMLRAYAERSFRSPPPSSTPPSPFSGNGMRQLYSQTPTPSLDTFGLVSKPTPPSPASLYPDMPPNQEHDNGDEPRGSFAVSEESRYGVENAEHGVAN